MRRQGRLHAPGESPRAAHSRAPCWACLTAAGVGGCLQSRRVRRCKRCRAASSCPRSPAAAPRQPQHDAHGALSHRRLLLLCRPGRHGCRCRPLRQRHRRHGRPGHRPAAGGGGEAAVAHGAACLPCPCLLAAQQSSGSSLTPPPLLCVLRLPRAGHARPGPPQPGAPARGDRGRRGRQGEAGLRAGCLRALSFGGEGGAADESRLSPPSPTAPHPHTSCPLPPMNDASC